MGSRTKHIMSAAEKYFFDFWGYFVVRRALTAEEVAACNGAIDHFVDRMSTRSVEGGGLAGGSSALAGESGRQELGGMLGWPAPHRGPFRRLLVHPVAVSRLNEMSGKGFPLDHGPLLIRAHKGTEPRRRRASQPRHLVPSTERRDILSRCHRSVAADRCRRGRRRLRPCPRQPQDM